MKRFANRTALITGGAGAFGIAIGRRLAEEGAIIFLADLREPDREIVETSFREIGRPYTLLLDVMSAEDWNRVVS